MLQRRIRGTRSRFLSALAAGCLSITGLAVAAPPANADGPGSGSPWVVSVGDSYISGEAGRWAGNSNVSESYVDALGSTAYFDNAAKTAEQINRCHRSTSASVHLGGTVSSLNLTCSGAKTSTFISSSGYFKPGLDFYDSSGNQGQALMLQNFAASHNVKMVALSIGGNDFNFSGIVQECVTGFLTSLSWSPRYCKNGSTVADAMSAGTITTNTTNMAVALQNIRIAMRNAGYADDAWTLMVQNYPSPIPASSGFRYSQSGYTRQSTGGCGFWNADADYAANTILPTINNAVRNAISQSGLSNVKTMNLSEAFNGRRLCENTVGLLEEKGYRSWTEAGAVDSTEWISQIRTVSTMGSNYYVQESLHPNYWAQLALRSCLRQAYNNGSPKSGTCTRAGNGLLNGEPVMKLQ